MDSNWQSLSHSESTGHGPPSRGQQAGSDFVPHGHQPQPQQQQQHQQQRQHHPADPAHSVSSLSQPDAHQQQIPILQQHSAYDTAPPTGNFSHQQFHATASPSAVNNNPTPHHNFPPAQNSVAAGQSPGTLSPGTLPPHDGNGDVAMQDAHAAQDGHAGRQYPSRLRQPPPGRALTIHSQEPSSAATRYSPQGALSPTSPYVPKQASASQYGPETPQLTRQLDYASQSPYLATARHQSQQAMPLSPYNLSQPPEIYSPVMDNTPHSADQKSPRRPVPQSLASGLPAKPTVPGFRKVRCMDDLRPKVNAQPPFRRANPEGGFISVCGPFLAFQLKSTACLILPQLLIWHFRVRPGSRTV